MATDITVVQTVSHDQVSVADDLATLLSDSGIDATDIVSINIVPFGANQFLIVVAHK